MKLKTGAKQQAAPLKPGNSYFSNRLGGVKEQRNAEPDY